MPSTSPAGIFVGLCVLDIVQSVDHVPAPNEKTRAIRQTVAAGGPAANAAVAFAHLGGTARLLTGIGAHPLAAGIKADLAAARVELTDLAAGRERPPAVSTIMVTAGTGERAVVSTNAGDYDLAPPADLAGTMADGAVLHLDGHHPRLAAAAATAAHGLGRPVLLDGGSWKPHLPELLPRVDVAICSSDFRPPGTAGPQDVLDFLRAAGVPWCAVTRGEHDVLWRGPDGAGAVPVPRVRVADTLGAGDVFHGVAAAELARHGRVDAPVLTAALARAAELAARSCASFGTRAWLADGGPGQ